MLVEMATDVCERLGKRIRELRKRKGWRQIDLAAHSEIGKNHISELEQGRREICLRNLIALAEALGVTADFLLKDL